MVAPVKLDKNLKLSGTEKTNEQERFALEARPVLLTIHDGEE
jgi:hypothetical protein